MGSPKVTRGLGEISRVQSSIDRKKDAGCPPFRWVLRKRRGSTAEFAGLQFELLPECRTIRRSASISVEAVSLRKKPFAIGKRDSQDRLTMAA
jgi:hypothetical protein